MVRRARDGSTWRIGTNAEIAWIANGTTMGRAITAAIPPVFEAYATAVLPYEDEAQDKHDRAVLTLLSEHSPGQPWWLGYLDTGADDIVFPDAPKVTLYSGWRYVLVEAGPEQAATWRHPGSFFPGVLPDRQLQARRHQVSPTREARLDSARRSCRRGRPGSQLEVAVDRRSLGGLPSSHEHLADGGLLLVPQAAGTGDRYRVFSAPHALELRHTPSFGCCRTL
jgi:hypothetical protein